MKKKKTFLKIFLIGFFLIFVFLLISILYIKSSSGNALLKKIIVGQVEDNLYAKIEIGKLETNLFSYFKADQIKVYPSLEENNEPFLYINKIKINYNLANVIFNNLGAESLIIDNLTFNLMRDSTGKFNLPSINVEAETDTSFELPFYIGITEINNAKILYDDQLIPINASIKNLNIFALRNFSKQSYKIKASIDSSSILYFEKPLVMRNFILSGKFNENLNTNIDTFYSKFAGLNIGGNLVIDNNSVKGKVDFNGNLIHLTKVLQDKTFFNQLKNPIDGKLNFLITNVFSDPDISCKLEIPQYKIVNTTVNDFKFKGRFHLDSLDVTDLSLQLYGGKISLSGFVLNNDSFSNNIKLIAKNINLSQFINEFTSSNKYLSQNILLNSDASISGSLIPLEDLKLNSKLKINGDTTNILSSQISFLNSHLVINSTNSPVNIKSDIDLKMNSYKGKMNIKIPSITPLASIIGFKDFDGDIEADSKIYGNFSENNFETQIKSSGIFFNKYPILDSLFAYIQSEGNEIFINKSWMSGNINNLDSLATLFGLDGVRGRISYSFNADGIIENPNAELKVEVSNPSYSDYKFDQSNLLLELKNKQVAISDFNLKKNSDVISANGNINFHNKKGQIDIQFKSPNLEQQNVVNTEIEFLDPENFGISARSKNFNLTLLNEYLPDVKLSKGDINWNFYFRQSKEGKEISLPFEINSLTLNNSKVDRITGELNLINDQIKIDSIKINIDSYKTFINSSLDLNKDGNGFYYVDANSKFSGNIYGDSLDLNILNSFVENSININGLVNFNLDWNGTLVNPNINGDINLTDGNIESVKNKSLLSKINGSIEFRDSTIETNNFNWIYNKIPMLFNFSLKQQNKNSLSTSIILKSNEKNIIESEGVLNDSLINLTFTTNSLDLSLASPFLPTANKPEGLLNVDLSINGNVRNPNINGNFDLNDFSFDPDLLNLKIEDGNAHSRIASNQFILDSADFDLNKGHLSMNGNAVFEENEIKKINFKMKSSGIIMKMKDVFLIKLKDADLNFSSIKNNYELSGNIHLGESKIAREVKVKDLWNILVSKTEGVLEKANNQRADEPLDLLQIIDYEKFVDLNVPDYLKNLKYDINLQNSDSVWIENNVLKIRLFPNLGLRGNVEAPILTGRITAEDKGQLLFLDRKFDITNFIIDFSDPSRINPILNIAAESEVTEQTNIEDKPETYFVSMNINGPLDEFDFNLASEPTLESSDIISLLSLGITYEKLQSNEDVNSLLSERSQILATKALSDQMDKLFGKLFGEENKAFDHIGIGGNVFDVDQTRLEISKMWSNKVEVSYSTSVKSINQQILEIKYKINDYFFLEGKTDQQEETGADLKFRLKFK